MLNARTYNKDLVLIFFGDMSGCSHYRLRWNSLYCGGQDFGFTPVLMPFPVFDAAYLARAKALVFQRPVHDDKIEIVERYKALQPKFGYKMVWECDDQVFTIDGQCIPEYNTAHFNFDGPKLDENCKKTLPLFDEIVVSTNYLKQAIEKKFDVHNVTVIKNVVPRFLWSYPRKEEIKEDLVKPTVLYSGSPCHYTNPIPRCPQFPNGVPPHKGDMDNAWCDWVIKNVRAEKIKFVVMGSLPWFWECIRDRITVIPWVDCNSFPRQVMETKADFSIAPLVENTFNKCKSSLRFTESCAAGQVFMGSVFDDSPYLEAHPMSQFKTDVTVEEIDDRFAELCKKDNYNKLLNWQYDFINASGCWLEADKHINQWLDMIDNGPVGRKLI